MEPKDVLMYEVIVTREATPGAWIIIAAVAVIAFVAALLMVRAIDQKNWLRDGIGLGLFLAIMAFAVGFIIISHYIQGKDYESVERYVVEDIGLSDVNYLQSGFMAVDQDGRAVYGEVISPGNPNPLTTPKDVTYRVFVYQAR